MSDFAKRIFGVLKETVPKAGGLHEPCFIGNETKYVTECIETGWVSSVGKFVDRIEADLTKFTGAKYAVATVNGTAALHICLKLAGVLPGDEVLIPALTFVATANAVAYCDAFPHFVDSDEASLGIDPAKLDAYLKEVGEIRSGECFNRKTGRRIKALVPVHTFGHPVDIEAILELCNRHRIELIEDAAESLGSYYKGQHTGTFGRLAALSFNGNKIVTTGGGGAILTNDPALAKRAKHITTTAKVPHRWEFVHDEVGYNYRMPNINAALGCAQLESLPGFLESKRKLAERYRAAFSGMKGVTLFTEPKYARSNYWLNVLILDEELAGQRDALLELTNSGSVGTRPAWVLMHKLRHFSDCPRMDLSRAESLERRLICIPSSAFL